MNRYTVSILLCYRDILGNWVRPILGCISCLGHFTGTRRDNLRDRVSRRSSRSFWLLSLAAERRSVASLWYVPLGRVGWARHWRSCMCLCTIPRTACCRATPTVATRRFRAVCSLPPLQRWFLAGTVVLAAHCYGRASFRPAPWCSPRTAMVVRLCCRDPAGTVVLAAHC